MERFLAPLGITKYSTFFAHRAIRQSKWAAGTAVLFMSMRTVGIERTINGRRTTAPR